MNIDNRDFELLNKLDKKKIKQIILNYNIKFNNDDNKDKLIKLILTKYYIDNNNNTINKKEKNHNSYVKKYNLLKASFMAGNDNEYNIKLIEKLKNNI